MAEEINNIQTRKSKSLFEYDKVSSKIIDESAQVRGALKHFVTS